MPHIIVEYAQNLDNSLDLKALVRAVHEGALRADLFEPEAIKVRAIAYSHYLVAGEVQDFIHLRVQILSGRSEPQKQHLSQCLFESAESVAAAVHSLSVEVVDMDRFSYIKRTG
ncbi:MAG: 5-carboxymethyl-2-hydroxymuconate isomerase [Motiliproteus sp.]|jgi:5-carboxymethyl-2-hydroxymuconate isomerase